MDTELGEQAASQAWTPFGFGLLDDPSPFEVDGTTFTLAYSPGLVPAHFTLVKTHDLLRQYRRLLPDVRDANVFELGIAYGGSLAWLALEGRPAKLIGADIRTARSAALDAFVDERGLCDVVRPHYGVDQADRARLVQIVRDELGAEPLDLVIDDASHELAPTRASFEALFPMLRPGGLYVIEDWAVAHIAADLVMTKLAEPDSPERDQLLATIGDSLRDGELAVAPEHEPMGRLVIELMLAQATWNHAIEEVTVNRYWIMVRRGTEELDPETFRLRDLYVDPFGLDPSARRD